MRKLPNNFWQAYVEHSFEVTSLTSLAFSFGAGETTQIAISAYVEMIKGKQIIVLFENTPKGVIPIPESEAKRYCFPEKMYV